MWGCDGRAVGGGSVVETEEADCLNGIASK